MPAAWNARWRVGVLAPGLLAAVFVADALLRFVSIDPLTFRAWEALSRYRPPGAPFEANRQYYRERSYGDTGAVGNLPEWREYHPERFTTDARGFRNLSDPAAAPPAVILTGDSFAVGSGVSDRETLSSRLTELLGRGVYNASGIDVQPDRLVPLARAMGLRRGVVLALYSEDRELPVVPTERRIRVNRFLAEAAAPVATLIGRVRGLLEVSPLRIVSEQAFKTLANDWLLPNSYRANAIRARLRNGDTMLFAADRVRIVLGTREVSAAYWSWLQRELHRDQFDLLVVLVPSKFTVYRQLLVPPQPAPENDQYLGRLARALNDAGVQVVNLTPQIAASAAENLDRHIYLYRRDDIHWNSRGIALAASLIRPYVAAAACVGMTPGRPKALSAWCTQRKSAL